MTPSIGHKFPPIGSFRSIQGKLILILLILVIPTLLFQFYIYNYRLETRRAEELQTNLELARSVAKTFDSFLRAVLTDELLVGLAFSSSQPLPKYDQDRILAKAVGENPSIWQLFWVNPAGTIVASAAGPEFVGTDVSDREYFRQIVLGRDWVVSDLMLSKSTGKPCFTISRGIRNENGSLEGLAVACILPERLGAILSVLRIKGGGISVIDSKGMLLYRQPFTDYAWEDRYLLKRYPIIAGALQGNEITTTIHVVKENDRRLSAFVPVPSVGWVTAAGRSEDAVMSAIKGSLLPQTIAFMTITLAAFSTALLFSRRISTSIAKLRNHAIALGRGESQTPLMFSGTAELDDLAGSFNKMAEDIESRERERRLAEAAMRLKEAELKEAQRLAHIGSWYWDARTDKITGTNELLRIYGFDPATQLMPCFREQKGLCYPVEDWERLNAAVQTTIESGMGYELDVRAFRGGEPIWVTTRGEAVHDDEGRIVGLRGTVQDITERKRTEARLAADIAALTRMHELSGRLLDTGGLQPMLQEIMDAAITIMNAEMGTLQLLLGDSLRIVAAHGHEASFIEFFESAESKASVCGEATMRGERLTIPDIEASSLFVGTAALVALREAGVRAVQSTPMISRKGTVLGTLTTQWTVPHTPDEHDLWRIDLLVRQAADLIEHTKAEEELLKSRAGLELIVQRRTSELQTTNKELQRANDQLRSIPSRLITAQEDERKRLAAELHDSIGQTLAALKFRIEHTLVTFRAGKAKEALRLAEDFVPALQRAIDETRAIYMGLRPKILEDFGVIAGLLWYRDELIKLYPERHIEVNISVEETEISDTLTVPIFRIAQEALNNICKHSKAEWVDLTLAKNGTLIELIVSDDGQGMDLEYILHSSTARSLGLISMRERAELTGGNFSIESAQGEGTTVRVEWPFSDKKDSQAYPAQ